MFFHFVQGSSNCNSCYDIISSRQKWKTLFSFKTFYFSENSGFFNFLTHNLSLDPKLKSKVTFPFNTVSNSSRMKISSLTAVLKTKVSSPSMPALMVVRERERRRFTPPQRESHTSIRKDQRLFSNTSLLMIHPARSRDWNKSHQTLLVPTWLTIQIDSPVEEPELCSTSLPQTVRDFQSQNKTMPPKQKKLLLQQRRPLVRRRSDLTGFGLKIQNLFLLPLFLQKLFFKLLKEILQKMY